MHMCVDREQGGWVGLQPTEREDEEWVRWVRWNSIISSAILFDLRFLFPVDHFHLLNNHSIFRLAMYSFCYKFYLI